MWGLFSSVQFSGSVMSNSLWPYGLQHASLPVHYQLPELTQTHVHDGREFHPTISSSVIPFSSCLQSFPASGSFQVSQFFASGGQSIGASASVFPMNIQNWFPCSPRNSQESSPTLQFKSINSLVLTFLYRPTLTSYYFFFNTPIEMIFQLCTPFLQLKNI